MFQDGPFVGESLPLVVPVVNNESGDPVLDASEARIWLEGPSGTIIGDELLSEGSVSHLGGGLYRAVFVTSEEGVHIGRSMVTGPDGLKKGSHFEFEVYPQ